MKGLVLEGGGVKGSYQIGAFYALKNCGIKIDGFVGTSIGSFNAAMLACNKNKELLKFWNTVNPGELFGIDKKFIDNVNNEELSIQALLNGFEELKKAILNLGLDNTKLLKIANKLLDYKELKKSKKDFGLVTVKISKEGFTPLYISKEDIKNQDNLVESVMASCYFPGIKEQKLIDNHYYIDGGFYDVSPVKMLIDKGYDEIYIINVKGIGIHRKIPRNKAKIITIKPSRENGRVIELKDDIIKDNIMMGYYDTLRIIKKLDGYKYCFKNKNDNYYKFITRKVDKRLLRRVNYFFNSDNIKDTVIKAFEYVLEHDKISYYDVYNPTKLIRKYKNNSSKHFVYRFIKELKFIF